MEVDLRMFSGLGGQGQGQGWGCAWLGARGPPPPYYRVKHWTEADAQCYLNPWTTWEVNILAEK